MINSIKSSAYIRTSSIYIWALKKTILGGVKFMSCLLGGLFCLLGEEATLGNGDSSQQLVQLLVVTDGQLQVTGDDPGLLVVTGSITCQLKDLSSQVLHDGGQVDGGTGTDTLSIVSLAEQTVDTSHGELKSSTAGSGLCLSLDLASFTTSRHVDRFS